MCVDVGLVVGVSVGSGVGVVGTSVGVGGTFVGVSSWDSETIVAVAVSVSLVLQPETIIMEDNMIRLKYKNL